MHPTISLIIPAYNEQATIQRTLLSLCSCEQLQQLQTELLVVNDGSEDDTEQLALPFADRVLSLPQNRGKGEALQAGVEAANGAFLVFLDADLQESARHAYQLLKPVLEQEADLSIAKLPPARRKGGLGLVRKLASHGIWRLSGYRSTAPLSGQRAMTRQVMERIRTFSPGFGIEVGFTIDAARDGFRITEVEVPFHHRESGRDWSGVLHRGKQFVAVGRTLWSKR
ncbi:glycosyltransferase family 2 protein [Marinicrinis sediminis]|uniref:Glucosyl-3-phosphoglycerate synthase n=1 Tax=Marinicrinis sediminis TaxID=1652465 RepID=A0ABW5RDZ0_9BACL